MKLTDCMHELLQNARPPLPAGCPVALSHLINRCWATNPDKRPHFREIVSLFERYTISLEEDPTFFSTYKPAQQQTLLKCFPSCIAVRGDQQL